MNAELKELYFKWICELAFPDQKIRAKYHNLLRALDHTNFKYLVDFDENRMIDGINLRYRFYYEQHGYNINILNDDSANSCSVLEMMIALSLRCDEEIMFDSDVGKRTHIWFFEMLKNLGLSKYTDPRFDLENYIWIIEKFLNREYSPDGTGGLFIINTRGDIRSIEIWYQLCWFLEEKYRN